MKRFAIAAMAALMAASPMAASAQQYNRGHDNDRGRDNNNRNDRNDRNDNRGNRWNQREHNGYYMNGRFYYGQPTAQVMGRRDYRPAYQQWRRGDRLPTYARGYREVNWQRERLRAPPRGYHYVRDDRGEVLLVGIATGVILSILLNNSGR